MSEFRLLLVGCDAGLIARAQDQLRRLGELTGAAVRCEAVSAMAAAEEWLALHVADLAIVQDDVADFAPSRWSRMRMARPGIPIIAVVPDGTPLEHSLFGPDVTYTGAELDQRTLAHVLRLVASRAWQAQEHGELLVRLRAAFENQRQAFVMFDRGGRVLLANKVARRWSITLFGRELAVGDGLLDLVTPETADVMRRRIERVFGGETVLVERSFRTDGGENWYELTYEPMRDAAGEIRGVCFSALDVTERRRAEAAARHREAELRAIVDYTQDWESWVGPEQRLIWVSSAVERMTGYTPDECLTMADYPLPMMHPLDRERIASLLRGDSAERLNDVTIRLLRKTGEMFWGSLSSQPVFGAGGEPLGRRYSVRDITERMISEKASQEASDRYRSLFEYAALGIFQSGLDGRLIAANQTFAQMQGFVSAEEMTASMHDVAQMYVEPEMREHVVQTVCARPGFARFEVQLRRADGRPITVNMNIRLVRDARGRELYLEGFVEDITDRKLDEQVRRQLEARVQQVQKLESLAVLAGGVAHDFNNLLMVILGNASLALIEMEGEAPARTSIQQIEQCARKAAELTNQMLAYAGGGRSSPQALNLSQLLADMRQLIAATLPWNAQLVYELDEELPEVRADGSQLRQIIVNLATNAAEALDGEEGRVTVKTGAIEADRGYLGSCYLDDELPPGRYAYIEVSDTGEGFDEITKARLFEPFFTTKFMGRGLGLAAVLGIVRGHRGAIHVDSVPGQGSTFRVLLPAIATAALEPSRPLPVSAEDVECGTVLVVDDDELVRHVTRSMLEKAGYEVVIARDGVEAVELFEEDPARFSVVLLDLTMPRMDGQAAYQRIRTVRRDARVVLSSGYSEEQARARIPLEGLAGFIQKPYRPQDLLEKLRQAVVAQI